MEKILISDEFVSILECIFRILIVNTTPRDLDRLKIVNLKNNKISKKCTGIS